MSLYMQKRVEELEARVEALEGLLTDKYADEVAETAADLTPRPFELKHLGRGRYDVVATDTGLVNNTKALLKAEAIALRDRLNHAA